MSTVNDQSTFGNSNNVILFRPPSLLNELPIEYRWEFTKRHPNYLLFWELARRHLQQPEVEEHKRLLGEVAVLVLHLIGVTDIPPPPGTKFEDIGATDLSQAWGDGAISMITFRGLVGLMLRELSPESRSAIGRLFVDSVSTGDREAPHGYHLFSEFMGFRDASLDKTPTAPIIGINVEAPLRTIVSAVEKQVREWKTANGIPEQRRRDDKLPTYLEVWDLREGWVGDHYDRSQERTLREIAADTSETVSTVCNRYKSAFRYVAGREFSPEDWALLFGVLKFSRFTDSDLSPSASRRRPLRSRTHRPVPESVVAPRQSPEGHGGTFLERMAFTTDTLELADLQADIRLLLEKGHSDEQIVDELELSSDAERDLLDHLRQRFEDGI